MKLIIFANKFGKEYEKKNDVTRLSLSPVLLPVSEKHWRMKRLIRALN